MSNQVGNFCGLFRMSELYTITLIRLGKFEEITVLMAKTCT